MAADGGVEASHARAQSTDDLVWPHAQMSVRWERFWAAASHLGVPFWSVVLPLLIWGMSPNGSFRRTHARRAFSFQMAYLFVYIGCSIWAFFVGARVIAISAVIGFVLELPQVVRALRGKDPYPFPPLDLLKP